MMEKLSAAYISELCGGRLLGGDTYITGIVRDNREIRGNEMFVAICGEKFDGHDFVHDAQQKGASAVLVSREIQGLRIPQIIVDDTVAALGKIAKGYLETLSLRRVC
ncbi:MAG: UDP-N-acetylmuramoyl-tripeptide--D-alanyl-D-alanine ligase, partial [Oscillospiraceae bacterium]|nr:UDP-N-acetylmuramoyl-tripeptide--D-alanyl-D-alanine ligase [Oscillospiraceae bacterium]